MSNPLHVVKQSQPWYQEGLRFKCTECGQCCTGSPGYIWVNEDEIVAIAAHLNISINKFAEKYLVQVGNRYSLLENPLNYDCVFLKNKKCSIYSARPTQCRTFPWWPRNLNSLEEWNKEASYCEGINHPDAPIVSLKVIEEQLDYHKQNNSF